MVLFPFVLSPGTRDESIFYLSKNWTNETSCLVNLISSLTHFTLFVSLSQYPGQQGGFFYLLFTLSTIIMVGLQNLTHYGAKRKLPNCVMLTGE